MINQLNTIIRQFGGNRFRLHVVTPVSVRFSIGMWGTFEIYDNGEVFELLGRILAKTPNSKWLEGVSRGKVRNDDGVLV
jgi:hypothetical protein